ncbi:sensor histidine kinase [Microbacterium yannicii]|uniref:sensor histidine kinase n=1 Tax=Microbacterium yannicii TaxID=671622 RepID=UPI000308AE4A|nr:HAMP domain-containing sensor histidine kinase [Microbacterium yannicii]
MTDRTGERPPGISVRVKLALSYAGFLVVAGIALFVVGFLLLRFVPTGAIFVADGGWAPNRSDLIEVFVRYASWAMAALVIFGLVGGWLLAGLVLRPLGRITDAAAHARDGHFGHRVALPGPRTELTDLADALDAMLDRVEHTIDEERRFAANASHELRTPHAIIRTMVEVAQADAEGRDVDVVLQRIATTNDRAIATTEALLALSRAGRDGGAVEKRRVDLTAIVAEAIAAERADASARGIRFDTSFAPAVVSGDPTLLAQLAANLMRNAVVHNSSRSPGDGGWVRVAVWNSSPVELIVENSGPVIDPPAVATLTEPFVRGEGRTRGAGDGAGLGLAIVASIVRVHGGTLTVNGMPEGGFHVRVALPR